MKKVIKISALILWMIIIFLFSNQNGQESGNLSNGFINQTIIRVYEIFNKDATIEEKTLIIKKVSLPVRKLAHFTVFLVLGVLISINLEDLNITNKNKIILSILFCILYAISDELHQLFIPGRSCCLKDVLIDTSGSICGISIKNMSKKFARKID